MISSHETWVAAAVAPPGIVFAREEGRLDPVEYTDLVRHSGLGRPVNDAARMAALLAGSNLVVTARAATAGGRLVGAARSLSDFAYCCYLSDLCVDPAFQGQGIGRALIGETKRIIGPQSMLLLLSSRDAMSYYPRIAMELVNNGFVIRRDS